jgi:hypothetical protein
MYILSKNNYRASLKNHFLSDHCQFIIFITLNGSENCFSAIGNFIFHLSCFFRLTFLHNTR